MPSVKKVEQSPILFLCLGKIHFRRDPAFCIRIEIFFGQMLVPRAVIPHLQTLFHVFECLLREMYRGIHLGNLDPART